MSTNPKLSLIVAKSRNGVIGVDGDLPWRLSSDLKFFKATTLGKPVLMGRVTWESLPFPLPGRPNLVLTRNGDYKAPKAELFNDVHAMIGRGYELAGLTGADEIMLYITEVDAMIEGDAHFPAIRADEWAMVSETPHPQGEKDDFPFTVRLYERR